MNSAPRISWLSRADPVVEVRVASPVAEISGRE